MKNYVITIMDNMRSVEVADRCIASGHLWDIEIEKWAATTPRNGLTKLMVQEGIKKNGFEERFSRMPECMSAFMSHYRLWKLSVELNEEITIFEHDAVICNNIPELVFMGCISFGEPSYGKWVHPPLLGKNKLVSKQYFPGAHAYRVNPWGATQLIQQAKRYARPTDVFLENLTFNFLEEYYPWPVSARDSFTTIQNDNGIQAKHSYIQMGGSGYEII